MSTPVHPAPVKTEFHWPLRVYWEDTDAGGIVFYANHLKFFERARTEWLRSLGIGQQTLRDATGGMFVVSDTHLKYHRPARLDDELLVTACLLESGRASLTIGQRALKINPNAMTTAAALGCPKQGMAPSRGSAVHEVTSVGATLICEGTIRIGWVDAATLKSARIPQAILEALK
jgi:acyl-CoA thioester hydrolase